MVRAPWANWAAAAIGATPDVSCTINMRALMDDPYWGALVRSEVGHKAESHGLGRWFSNLDAIEVYAVLPARLPHDKSDFVKQGGRLVAVMRNFAWPLALEDEEIRKGMKTVRQSALPSGVIKFMDVNDQSVAYLFPDATLLGVDAATASRLEPIFFSAPVAPPRAEQSGGILSAVVEAKTIRMVDEHFGGLAGIVPGLIGLNRLALWTGNRSQDPVALRASYDRGDQTDAFESYFTHDSRAPCDASCLAIRREMERDMTCSWRRDGNSLELDFKFTRAALDALLAKHFEGDDDH